MRPDTHDHRSIRDDARAGAHGLGIYLGEGRLGPVLAGAEQGCLVLGPPRSGKTSSVVVPNVLAAPGGVVAVSTKPDVLVHTAEWRRRLGRCVVFDPSGLTRLPEGVDRVGWSPLEAAREWDDAVLVADAMVGASQPVARSAEAAHWAERASALLAPLLHAAALDRSSLDRSSLDRLVASVNRREPKRAEEALSRHGAVLAADVLEGIVQTDPREQSGIWSSAAGALAAYRSSASLATAALPPLDPRELLEGRATLFVVAPSDHQQLVAPIVAGLLRDLRSAAYRSHPEAPTRPPVLLVLDELANIAPLHDLPALVAEGASQGLVTLACLQDLSQARQRWGASAEGFLSLFGAKLVLAGIGDVRTLQAVSLLAGDVDRPVVSRPHGLAATVSARQGATRTLRRLPRLPPDLVATPPPGTATLVLAGEVQRIGLTPFYMHSPWREMAGAGTARTHCGQRHARPDGIVRHGGPSGLERPFGR